MTEISEKSNRDEFGATAEAEKSSRLSGAIFFLLNALPIFLVIAFGGVDVWALCLLSAATGLISILWLTDAWLKKEFRFSASRLQIPLFGLILIGIVQLLPIRQPNFSSALLAIPANGAISLAAYPTRLAIVQLIAYFIFFAAALTFTDSYKRLQKVVLATIIFSSLMAFYGILQRLANLDAIYGLRPFNQAVPFSSFVNQHHFAAFMEMTIGITLALLFGRATKNDKRIFLMIAVVTMGIALVFTSSRGGMISLFGVVGFVTVANLLRKPARESDAADENSKGYRRNFAFIGGGLILILILFGAVLLLGGDESLLRGIGFLNPDDISNGRTHFWQVAWQIFLDHPILGAGLDAFAVAFSQYDSWNGAYRIEQAHNDYLQILADAGILGFACVAAFIFLLFNKGIRVVAETENAFRRSAALGALAGCAGILIHSFFDFPLRTPSNALYFLTLIVLATVAINSPKSARRRKRRTSVSASEERLIDEN